MNHFRLLLASLATLVAPSAYAQGISGGYCYDNPSTFADCDGSTSGSGTTDICFNGTGGAVICDLTRNGNGSLTTVNAIKAAGSKYMIFGNDAAGNHFCCEVTTVGLTRIDINGGNNTDTIDLEYYYSGTTYKMQTYGATTNFTASVAGREEIDFIYGSSFASAYYNEYLHGDAGNDEIEGRAGDETITGDGDNDLLNGDAGNDVITGGLGNDTICGGPNADNLQGNDGDDDIWGMAAASTTAEGDTVNGGPDVTDDECDNASSPANCEIVYASIPGGWGCH